MGGGNGQMDGFDCFLESFPRLLQASGTQTLYVATAIDCVLRMHVGQ